MLYPSRPSARRRIAPALALVTLAVVGATLSAQSQVVPGTNVNMVSGTTFPDGDPYLQRQNEPSSAVSTRNPLHILGGANDYRTVDLPGPFDPLRGFKMNADAWMGLFKSLDGGQTWKSTLVPGYPQDISPEGLASPIKGREASTDPVMRAGTNGLFYYAGVAFDRGDNKPSTIFMARYVDLNNLEAGDPFGYVDTRIVDADGGGRFLDKPAVATDIPRSAATCTITSRQSDGTTHVQTMPAGNVYVAYSAFTGHGADEQSVILFSRSTNCGATWSAPKALSTGSRLVQNAQVAVSPTDGSVYVTWRRFKYQTQDDAVMMVRSIDGGVNFSKVLRISGVRPFDQGTTATSFRSNGFQTMAIDGTGRVYVAWPDRGYAAVRSDPVSGDSRIVVSTSATGATWTVPRPVQTDGLGHQLMPQLTFHGGKLRLLYYDLREDYSQLFGPFIDELPILLGAPPRIRHTIDVFVAQALPGSTPAFTTARVSDYARGFMPGSTVEERLQFNPPNLPLFRQGAVPFMGDYIDLAPAPPFVLNDAGVWVHNVAASGSVVSHAFWADNRDVRAPADGNWANYTPVTSDAVGTQSRYDPTQTVPGCVPGQVGMRNQNVYTARVTDGLFVSAPGNSKSFNGFQRAFVIVAENATAFVKTYRLRIENQPIGGQASFLQFGPALTTLDVTTPVLSSVARTVFVTSQDEDARIRVSLTEITSPGGAIVAGGLSGSVVLNPDPNNPSLQNPSLQNPSLQNPLISEGEAYNPGITSARVGVPSLQNPSLQNPSLQNPSLQNPSIQNPFLQDPSLQNPSLQNPSLQNDAVANPSIVNAGITNPSLQNPSLQNPSLQNPSLQNVDLTNAGFSDTSWVITNEGNTTASYTVNLLLNDPPPAGFATQLILHKTFKTPAAEGCTLKEQAHTILLANIPNPQFVTDPTNPSLQNPSLQNPSLQNPTLALGPGESATITFRVVDPNIFDGVTYDASGAVTPAAVAQSVNSEDVATGSTAPQVAMPLTITTTTVPTTTPGAPINRPLQSVAGTGALVCSVIGGQLPPGVTLTPAGVLTGTPTTPGNYVFTVRCTDAAGRADEQTLSVQVDPAAPVSFDALWNGADTNWYNPANWSPRGVPAAGSRVYVSAATTVVPRLTADVTLRDLFLEPGATLDTNGFTLTITNNAEAGHTIIGEGRTVLTGDGATASGVFANLEIRGRITLTAPLTATGSLTLGAGARLELNGQALIVGGQLITSVTEGALPVVVGATGGSNGVFLTSGVNVNGLVIVGVPLTINAGGLTRFDNVTFSDFSPDAVQLTVSNPGLITHFPMNGLSFASTPATGQYVQANDTLDAGPPLVLDILGAVPADGTALTGISGGAIVNWIPNPGEANLAVTQTVAPVPSAAGTRLTYTITVTNGGPADATQVTLIPGVPVGATGTTTSTTQGTCTLGSGGWSCALGNLSSGSVAVAEVSFIPAAAGTLFTTAAVSSQTPDSVIANNFQTIAASIVPAGQGVNLTLTKTDSTDPVVVNAPFVYTLTATNAGTTLATNVVVTDHVPAGVNITYATSASGMCSAISSQVLCSFATLEPGQTVTMSFNATATAAGVVTNQAVVTSAEVELTPADNIATQTTVVVASAPPSADLSVTQSDSVDPVGPGQVFNYVLVAANAGPAFATGVVVTDTLPVGVNPSAATSSVGTCTIAGRTVTCPVGNLQAGGTATITITATALAAGLVTNTASIAGAELDTFTGNNTDSEETTISLAACAAPGYSGPVRLAMPSFDSLFVEQADLNGDGANDLVVSMLVGGLAVRLNQGGGNFAAAVPISLPDFPRGFALVDLNRDGRIDIAAATESGLAVVMGAGDGTFGTAATYQSSASDPITVTAADLDGDGDIDLILDASDSGDDLPVFRNNGTGVFAAFVDVQTTTEEPLFPVVADLNKDGRPDIAVGSGTTRFSVLLADGAGGYLPATSHGANGTYLIRGAADLDGDGNIDLVAQFGIDITESLQVLVLRGDGNGGFDAGTDVLAGPTAQSLRLADVNGDGRPDLVAHHPTRQTVAVQMGQAGGSFAAPVHFPAPYAIHPESQLDDDGAAEDFYSLPSVGDLNGDGQLDIAVGDASGAIQVLFSTCGQPAGDLSVAVQESADPVTEGTSFSYSVVVTNHGPATSSGALVHLSIDGPSGVRDAAPARFTAGTGASCVVADQHITCTVPALESTETLTLQATVSTMAGATLTFGAGVTSSNFDPTPGNNSAFETTTVTATGRNLVVTNTNDSGPGSLRQAIMESNADSGDVDRITFNIPGSGLHTITPQTGLPTLTDAVVLDGTSQPGYAGTPLIELKGSAGLWGLETQGTPGGTIRGLMIDGFDFGIVLFAGATTIEQNVVSGNVGVVNNGGGILIRSNGNIVRGNRIGTTAGGTAALPNRHGISVGGTFNIIGGSTAEARNLISGNTQNGVEFFSDPSAPGITGSSNAVQGNYIGTTANGLSALPNGTGIAVFNGAANTLSGNLVSGNTIDGITVGGRDTVIQGNTIGLNATGTAALANGNSGVRIFTGAINTQVGGSSPGAGNVISGNTAYGVDAGGSSHTIQGNLIGTGPSGSTDLGNGLSGVRALGSSASITIGGASAGARNVISGNNTFGVRIESGASNITVRGNYIGTDINGTAGVANSQRGIEILGGTATSVTGNRIAFNGSDGVRVAAGTGHSILGNEIRTNGALGINLGTNAVTPNDTGDPDTGANNLQNFPVLAAGSGSVQGTLNSSANGTFTIQFFGSAACDGSGNGEGETFLGQIQVTADGSGNATIPAFAAVAGQVVTATATSASGDTSEFSACVMVPLGPTTFTVTNTNDSGAGSLRQAILDANARANTTDTIAFNIAGAAPFTIGVLSALPTINDPVILDGRTQPGYSGTPIIELNGASAGANVSGLRLNAGSTVRGLVINRFSADGISLLFSSSVGGNSIIGNYLGTDVTGTAALANSNGVTASSPGNQIGGPGATDGNLISGNGTGVQLFNGATGTVVQGNRIGTNAAGSGPIPNGAGINVGASHGNTIGGSTAGAGNLISGNSGNGLWISGSNSNQVLGNLIGTNAAGSGAVANGYGMFVMGANNVVTGNVISGNTNIGISVAAGATATTLRGNRIGTTSGSTGSAPLRNGSHGVFLDGNGTIVGGGSDAEANIIANNGIAGVRVNTGTGHSLLRNSIFANADIGIDVGPFGPTANDSGDGDGGANNLQNFPVLTAVAGGVQASLNSTPSTPFTILFFGNAACDASGYGEGQTFLGSGSVVTDAVGNAAISFFAVSPVQVVTATATSAGGDTSEFSTCITSRPPNGRPVANAGPDQTTYVGRLVTLDGSGTDPDDDDLTYVWNLTTLPTGSQVELSNATMPSSSFTPDVQGTYTVQLIVNDGTDSSVADSVTVTVLTNEIALALVGAQVVGVTREAPVRVTLPFAAPSGGTTVTLTSAQPGFLSVVSPGTALIGAGQTVGQIMVRGEGSGTALVHANATGYGQGSLSVLVTHNLISTPSTLNVAFGGSTALPINIGPDPAPAGGLTLDVASSDADIEVLTPQVTVPQGALSVNATVRGARVGTANVTVSNPNYAPSTTVVTSRAELNIVQTSASFNQGLTPPTLTLRLESNGTQIAAQPALTVTLTSANTDCVTVPSSATIPAGLVSTSFSPAYGGTATLPCTTIVTASAADVTPDTVSITVNRPAAISVGGTLSVGAGLMDSASASVSAAQHGGLDVTITAGTEAQPGPVRLSRTATEVGTQSITVHLNNGQTAISYYVHGLENTTGPSTIALTGEGLTGASQTVDVVQPGVEILNLTPSMNTLSGPDTDVYVQVGITHPSYNNAQLWQVQNVRSGGPGFEVTLTNTSSAVARLRSDEPAITGGETGQVVKKTIPAGTYYTHAITTGTTYGFAFEPTGTGTTTVRVTAPGVVTMTSTGVRQVQVTSPVITAGSTVMVGAGLIDSASANLSAAQHGGVDVTITAGTEAQPGPVRLSRTATEVGTQSITVHLNNGQTAIPYYVHGLEDTTGSSTITLTAERFTSASHTVDVVQPGVEILNVTPSMNTLSGPDTDVYVQVGITHPSYNNAQLWQVQNVRPGGRGFEVTLTNSSSSVARLRSDEPAATGGQTGQVVRKTIPAGTYYTHAITTGTTYGLAFEPMGTGTTAVTVTAPGAVTMTTTGVRQVQVTSPVITAGSTVMVGAGLIDSAFANLSAAQHGGVDVTITAGSGAQPGPVRLSRTAAEVGTQSITVHLNNGQSSIPYYVHGLEDTTGSSTITLTAERFTSDSHTVDVVEAGVEILNLSGSFTNLSADDTDVYVQVGITHPSYNNAQLWQVQNVRPGSAGLEVTLTNSNVNVARLRSDEPAATGGQTGQVVKKTIPAGTYYTHAIAVGTTYGFAFEPLSNGATTVTVTSPRARTMTTTGVRQVTVTTPAISVAESATIGTGLMDFMNATLGATQHGGVDVTITSSAPSVVLVSPDTTTTGTASTVVHVNNNLTTVPFVIHGLENVSGTAVITLSAPGFTSTTMSVTVTPSSVEILNLASTTSAAAADDTDLYVQVGITHPSYNNSQLWQVQNVRTGSPGFIVTLTVDNPARAQLRSDDPPATGQAVTKPIRPGTYYTQRLPQSSGTTYGLAFDPLAQGTVVVTATGPPGTQPLGSSQRSVVINP